MAGHLRHHLWCRSYLETAGILDHILLVGRLLVAAMDTYVCSHVRYVSPCSHLPCFPITSVQSAVQVQRGLTRLESASTQTSFVQCAYARVRPVRPCPAGLPMKLCHLLNLRRSPWVLRPVSLSEAPVVLHSPKAVQRGLPHLGRSSHWDRRRSP